MIVLGRIKEVKIPFGLNFERNHRGLRSKERENEKDRARETTHRGLSPRAKAKSILL